MLVGLGMGMSLAIAACEGGKVSGETLACPGGLLACGELCFDAKYDPANCGVCGRACSADQVCSNGECASVCAPGTQQCEDRCTDTDSDPFNCGSCGSVCAGGFVCSKGKCSVACDEGLTNCAGACVDITSNADNCGACAEGCGVGLVCVGGACNINCLGGATKCGDQCVDLVTDPENCGACGAACASMQACVDQACAGLVCVAETPELCYSGPAGTLGVGACQPGLKTCVDPGTGYGDCEGEVVPAMSDACDDGVDEDCNGIVDDGCIPRSCKAIKDADATAANGIYTIDPDGDVGTLPPTDVNCEMIRDGGGWTLGVKAWHDGGTYLNAAEVGLASDGLALKGKPYKLSDELIRALIGSSNNFDLMADQAGFRDTANSEYVLVLNYTGYWKFDGAVEASSTPTTWKSFRISDNALAWTGELGCGASGAGINCESVIAGGNPQGGCGCVINMGARCGDRYADLFMGWNVGAAGDSRISNTRLNICNGRQGSRNANLNHRFWFRERP